MDSIRHVKYFKKLKKHIFPNKKMVVAITLIRLVTMILSLFSPLIYRYYIDSVISARNISNMAYVIGGYVVLFVFQTLAVSAGKYIETKYVNGLRVSLKKKMFEIYGNMDFETFEQESIGELRMRAEDDVEVVCRFYLDHCMKLFYSAVFSLCVIGILFFLNVYLTIFGIVMILISFFITKVLGVKIETISKKYRADQSEFDSMMHDAFQNWKEIKINSIEDRETEMLSEKWYRLAKSKMKSAQYTFLHGALMAFNLFFITRMNLFFFGGVLVKYELMTVPVMLIFMNYYEQLYSNIQTILNSVVGLRAQVPQIEKVIFTLQYINNEDCINEQIAIDDLIGNIEVKNLWFQYSKAKRYVLSKVSFTLEEGKSYAIVGKSGSGKTTLVKTLVGLYNPTDGEIRINNIDLRKVPNSIKHHYINIVMQDPQFFNLSILDNLLIADPKASMREIDEACRLANIYDFIQSLEEKYDTVIGENGIKLSGGQRQRLAIARTVLMKPKVLIFDEATSALDSENEKMVVKAVKDLAQFMKVIVISHRLSSILNCDEVIIIRDGAVVEKVTIGDAMKKNVAFNEMFNREVQ